MFPVQAAGSGRVLRVQAIPGSNPSAEWRLKKAAKEEKYDQIVCGMFWHRDQGVGTAFPLTPTHRQKAIWMTSRHVAAGEAHISNTLCNCWSPLGPVAVLPFAEGVLVTASAGNRKLTLSTNHNLKYSRDAVKHSVKFKANDHLNLEINDLPYPSEPSQRIHLRDHGVVKAFEVRHLDVMSHFLFPVCSTVTYLQIESLERFASERLATASLHKVAG